MNSKKVLFLLLFIGSVAGTVILGCKKIDLVRLAAVKTQPVSNIANTSVDAHGEVIDIGDGSVTAHGFCFATTLNPVYNSSSPNLGEVASEVTYSKNISGLSENTKYYLRAFIKDESGITYGEQISFITLGSGNENWLYYDNGVNVDGIGLTDGGSFDYAIRFTVQDLTNYVGFRISKIKFFPKAGSPTNYYYEVFTGTNPPVFQFYEEIPNPVIDSWNEYIPANSYYIEANKEVWVGIWVLGHPAGTYPAGVDIGPANPTGKADMISFDLGDTWYALSELDPPLYHNWNLRVSVTNQKGEEVILNNPTITKKEKPVRLFNGNADQVVSSGNKSNY